MQIEVFNFLLKLFSLFEFSDIERGNSFQNPVLRHVSLGLGILNFPS